MARVRPIRTEADYQSAVARIDALMEAQRGTAEGEELDVLVDLVEHYEDKHDPPGFPDPVSAIKFRMDQEGLREQDLVPYFGSQEAVTEVLAGERALTMANAQALHEHLSIPAEVLLRRPVVA